MSNSFVLPYINPDTDGICSAITYAYLLKKIRGESAIPIFWGDLDGETKFVLEKSGLSIRSAPSTLDSNDKYYVVDTHQKNQLPPDFPLASIVEILDHHPAGDDEAFPAAQITNEEVGAVATIIAERFKQNKIAPSEAIATLLYSAILSNTLNMKAPTTTSRDFDMVSWLSNYIKLDSNYVDMMFLARSDIGDKPTKEVLIGDYKEFDFSGTKVGMSQLETTSMDGFLKREDINQCMAKILEEKNLNHFIFNCTDIRKQQSVLITISLETRDILTKVVSGAEFKGNIAHFDRILLRKSDLIPQIKEYFSNPV